MSAHRVVTSMTQIIPVLVLWKPWNQCQIYMGIACYSHLSYASI